MENPITGPQHANPEQSAALATIAELLATHCQEASDSDTKDGKFSITFAVTFDRSHSPPKLKVTSRLSKPAYENPSGVGTTGYASRSPLPEQEKAFACHIQTVVDESPQTRNLAMRPKPQEPPKLLKIPEVAKRLGIAQWTAWDYCRSGILPHIRLTSRTIRVSEADLKDYLRSRTRF
jgi:predicted DNA-binding transcriptional regulator AlpA